MDCVSKSDIDQHLTLGMQLLARGQYSDALSHFHAAIGKEGPFINYVTQFEGSVMLMHQAPADISFQIENNELSTEIQ